MKGTTVTLIVCLIIFIGTSVLVIAGCTPESITTTNAVTTNQTTTTTTNTTTITKIAAYMTTTTTVINKEKNYSIVNIFVPDSKPYNYPIPILITVNNTNDQQEKFNIPILFTDMFDPTNIVYWVIQVTLEAGETREVLIEGISMKEGHYWVEADQYKRMIDVA